MNRICFTNHPRAQQKIELSLLMVIKQHTKKEYHHHFIAYSSMAQKSAGDGHDEVLHCRAPRKWKLDLMTYEVWL